MLVSASSRRLVARRPPTPSVRSRPAAPCSTGPRSRRALRAASLIEIWLTSKSKSFGPGLKEALNGTTVHLTSLLSKPSWPATPTRRRPSRASSASSESEVKWTVVPFNSSYAPGAKKFDFDINQISITPKRAERGRLLGTRTSRRRRPSIALKSPRRRTPRASPSSQDAKLGVQVGTTSLDAVNASIKPTQQPQVFNDSNDIVRALKQGQVDAIVVDLPTALLPHRGRGPEGAKIVGQFAAPGGDAGACCWRRTRSSPPCVNQALVEAASRRRAQAASRTSGWAGTRRPC